MGRSADFISEQWKPTEGFKKGNKKIKFAFFKECFSAQSWMDKKRTKWNEGFCTSPGEADFSLN